MAKRTNHLCPSPPRESGASFGVPSRLALAASACQPPSSPEADPQSDTWGAKTWPKRRAQRAAFRACWALGVWMLGLQATDCCSVTAPGQASANPALPGLTPLLTRTSNVTSFPTPQQRRPQSNNPSAHDTQTCSFWSSHHLRTAAEEMMGIESPGSPWGLIHHMCWERPGPAGHLQLSSQPSWGPGSLHLGWTWGPGAGGWARRTRFSQPRPPGHTAQPLWVAPRQDIFWHLPSQFKSIQTMASLPRV